MDQFSTPFGEIIEIRQIIYDSGVPLLRIKIIDGIKFSHFDVDSATAAAMAQVLRGWAEQTA